ncbi:unnamed protein product [Rhizoctonia solani]|uniref:Uncharacterized protein n=1 Tax=Rhizoctonia solani TaxID=456999 RepID=A0A8H3BN25_9AGAM|nr:unnamed protein product [Rhizoctonia solani]
MEGWGSSGKLQAQLLQETIHKAKEPQGENRPQVNGSGGYVVYDKLGVYFLPIDKVNELLLPEMQKQPLPNQNQLNSSVTKALLGSEEERENDDSKKWAKSIGLQTVLPENIRKLNGIMTLGDCNAPSKLQAHRLADTLRFQRTMIRKESPGCKHITAGYIVYDTKGVYFLPIKEVIRAIENALPEPEEENPGQAQLNEDITEILLSRRDDNPGLETMLPKGL